MAFITKITTQNHALRTDTIETATCDDIKNIIMNRSTAPTLYDTSTVDGTFLVYLMLDNDNAHLSLWRGHTCYSVSEVDADGFVNIGWNSIPAWSVVKHSPKILRAKERFIIKDQLITELIWKSETRELEIAKIAG